MAKQGPEAKFDLQFAKEFKRLGADTTKLHGNLYQQGLPDHLVLMHFGLFCLVENKVGILTKYSDVIKMYRPSQMAWHKRKPKKYPKVPIFTFVKHPHKDIIVCFHSSFCTSELPIYACSIFNDLEGSYGFLCEWFGSELSLEIH